MITQPPMIGILCFGSRTEEKSLFEALRRRAVPFERLDEDKIQFPIGHPFPKAPDVVLDRSIHQGLSLYALTLLQAAGIPTVNRPRVARICGGKILTTAALARAGLPVPKTVVAFTREAALEAIEAMGYPVALKPMGGSLRLLAKINDRDAAEAVLEHKETLGSYQHGIFYIQEYVNKPKRDIRAIVVGDQTIGSIYRSSDHWITNTARNGIATQMEVTPEIDQLCRKAVAAVGGGFLSVDLLEHPDGLLVNELNYTPEFHGFMAATGIPVADHVIDYVAEIAEKPTAA